MEATASITHCLKGWNEGSPAALARLIDLVYDQLATQARHQMRNECAQHTLQTSALVHETYLRLLELKRIDWCGKQHFLAMAASIMRRVLVDHARRKNASKRYGNAEQITLAGLAGSGADIVDVLELDKALERLAERDPLQMQIVELKFFGGLKITEIAEHLAISPATVKRKWTLAQAFLYRELTGSAAAAENTALTA